VQEFLVQIDIRLPAGLDPTATAALQSDELRRGRELVDQRAIRHIWRVPGRRANVGIWRADDATELHRLLVSLPMFPYMDVRVTPLAIHDVDGEEASE
jgi:muconolactone delta-isomerase